jgi:hypothetical protein
MSAPAESSEGRASARYELFKVLRKCEDVRKSVPPAA